MTMNLTEQLETVAEDIRRLCSVEVTSDDPEVRSVSVAMVALSTVINGYPNTVAPLEDRKVAVIVSGTRRDGFALSLVDVTLDSNEAIKFVREIRDNGGIATLDRVIGASTKPSEAAAILYRVARGMDTPRIVVAGGLFEDTAMRVAVEDLNSRI